jgi:xanthine dehydrogenase large subunit
MGQGLFQKVAQVAADRFGSGLDRDPDHRDRHRQGAQHLGHGGLVGQRPERHGGQAACDTIRDRIAAHLAERHQTPAKRSASPMAASRSARQL